MYDKHQFALTRVMDYLMPGEGVEGASTNIEIPRAPEHRHIAYSILYSMPEYT
jgi:hypothetical protein